MFSVGPEIMLRVASDALEWARKVSWETLPMPLNGPES